MAIGQMKTLLLTLAILVMVGCKSTTYRLPINDAKDGDCLVSDPAHQPMGMKWGPCWPVCISGCELKNVLQVPDRTCVAYEGSKTTGRAYWWPARTDGCYWEDHPKP